jgi:hypothetical protein
MPPDATLGFPSRQAATAQRYSRAMPDTTPQVTRWEYATVPLIVHATKQILDQWGGDGWELVQVVPGPDGTGLVAYLKRVLA